PAVRGLRPGPPAGRVVAVPDPDRPGDRRRQLAGAVVLVPAPDAADRLGDQPPGPVVPPARHPAVGAPFLDQLVRLVVVEPAPTGTVGDRHDPAPRVPLHGAAGRTVGPG